MNRRLQIAAIASLTLGVAGCGLFGDDEDELEPLELVDIEPTVNVKQIWKANLGKENEFLRVALQPAGDGRRIYAAGYDGDVVAFDPETGDERWRVETEVLLSSGPGVGEGVVVVGTQDGYAIALDADTGDERWRIYLEGEVLSTPVVDDDVVVVMTIDNRLHALRTFDGSQEWVVEQTTPVLTTRGSATPAVIGNSVYAGFDNGRLLAIGLETGEVEWDTLIAPPSGRSDLERLSDIEGRISVVGQDLYVSSYQRRVALIAAESGQELWGREISSHVGVTADWNSVYTTNSGGEVIALSRRNGAEIWRQASLLRREPTVPVSFNTMVVVGDFEGYLHFFSVLDGTPTARLRLGGSAISSDPVVVSGRLYIQSDSGEIAAYEVIQPPRPTTAPDVAEDDA
ncbi:MAG: outer membrane protein assembly factor BamB [Pseudomonadota bacterium]